MQDIERMLADLAATPPTSPSPDFEDRVFGRVAAIRRSRAAAVRQLPISAAIVVGALGLGLALGGAAAADRYSEQPGALSLTGQLAPSTLLASR